MTVAYILFITQIYYKERDGEFSMHRKYEKVFGPKI